MTLRYVLNFTVFAFFSFLTVGFLTYINFGIKRCKILCFMKHDHLPTVPHPLPRSLQLSLESSRVRELLACVVDSLNPLQTDYTNALDECSLRKHLFLALRRWGRTDVFAD